MATDYNANLIAELYSAKDVEEAARICDEMGEIRDLIFPRQIYEAYKKYNDTNMSHYFVSDLTLFKTPEVAEILKEIARKTERDSDILMMLDFLTDIECFETGIFNKIVDFFNEEIEFGIDDYELNKYFLYLFKTEEGKEILEPLLKTIFEDESADLSTRRSALKKLLKLNSKYYIDYYYNNYNLIKGTKTEIIFVNEISDWKNEKIPALHKQIMEIGSARAKEILQAKLALVNAKQDVDEKKQQAKVVQDYTIADVMSDIAGLRLQINTISASDARFGFPFFPANEELYKQGKPASDKESLTGCLMVLRSSLQSFNKENVESLDISAEDMKKVIPDVTDVKGTINRFHFLLFQKGIDVDMTIFGLRNLNRLVSKLAHPKPEDEPELIKLLREEKLLDLYASENFAKLHREILLRYRDVLSRMVNAILPN